MPPKPLLNVTLGFYLVTATSRLVSYQRYHPLRECLVRVEDRKALVSAGVILSSYELISLSLLKDLCSVVQTYVASPF